MSICNICNERYTAKSIDEIGHCDNCRNKVKNSPVACVSVFNNKDNITVNANGLKYDDDKLRYDLLPVEPIEELVKILTYGSQKYTDNSWQNVENGIDRYYAALLRHLVAWRKGEKVDSESGLPHLAHTMCNAMFLLHLDKE